MTAKQTIEAGKAILGIEFGSTRIKAVLIDEDNKPIAQGSHEWENQLVDGLWTYSTEAIWYGLQDCYADLRKDVQKQYDCEIEALAAIGGVTPTPVRLLPNSQNSSTTTSLCVGASATSMRLFSTMRSTYLTLSTSPHLLVMSTGR